jgi:hypothetical protein
MTGILLPVSPTDYDFRERPVKSHFDQVRNRQIELGENPVYKGVQRRASNKAAFVLANCRGNYDLHAERMRLATI